MQRTGHCVNPKRPTRLIQVRRRRRAAPCGVGANVAGPLPVAGYSENVPLSVFSPAVRDWFAGAFEAPTEVQAQAWPAIATGEHTLISAPTGSGKTLAAFLWALDKLGREPSTGSTRLVYVSPLKALAYDIDRNLRAPLRGIGADLSVGIRT